MMKKSISVLLLTALTTALLSACPPAAAGELREPQTAVLPLQKSGAPDAGLHYTDFEGKSIGLRTGTVWDGIIENQLGAQPAFYTELSAGIEDVRKGRLDGFITDYSAAKVFAATEADGSLTIVEVPAEIFSAPMGAVSMDQDLIDRFNDFMAEMKADGTFAEMQSRWLDTIPDLNAPMPDIPLTGTNGTLTVATNVSALPFAYMGANSEFKGYSVELMLRFAAREGMTVEFAEMEFGAMIPYVVSGKAHFAIANISITEERKKSVLFTDSIYDDRGGIIALKPGGAAAKGTRSYTELTGKRIGGVTGGAWDAPLDALDAELVYYAENSAGLEDVRAGRIFGHALDLSAARMVAATNDEFDYIEIPASYFVAPMGAISMKQDVIDRFNTFLAGVQADGTLADMQARWLQAVSEDPPMPDIPNDGANGTLTVATCGTMPPFMYVGNDNQLKGYSAELALRFGAQEGLRIEFVNMDFGALIPYVISGKADLSISAMSITEERKQSVLFSHSVYDDQFGVIVLKTSDAAGQTGQAGTFTDRLKTAVERNLITDNRWKLIVNGLGVTMIIAVLAQLFGTAFGCLICWLLTRKNRLVRKLGGLYCGLIYGTPIVVLLMITYYIIFGDASVSNVLVAVAAFTMVTGAGVAANLKGAIDTVDPVEIEAARSVGFSALKAFGTVTLPQAVRRALPGYTNGFVELVKATAIVGYIAIQDLTRAGDIIRSRTYDAYFPLLFVAALYLLVTTLCVQLFQWAVKKINKAGAA